MIQDIADAHKHKTQSIHIQTMADNLKAQRGTHRARAVPWGHEHITSFNKPVLPEQQKMNPNHKLFCCDNSAKHNVKAQCIVGPARGYQAARIAVDTNHCGDDMRRSHLNR